MTPPHLSGSAKSIVIGVITIAMGGLFVAYANIPTRVSVVEANQTGMKDRLESMDRKLDAILERTSR